ncbi:MAG TPA: VOC family protein [Gaiellaceae bacterium]|nr:VOC family protein [Gaiellaceae bacterium]
MRIKGIVWLGMRTERFDEMREFFLDITGVAPRDDPGLAVFDLASGDRIEVFDPTTGESYMDAPLVGFLVDDVAVARAELESRGIEFIGPIRTGAGSSWSHFRAPDGNVYELTALPGHPAYET